MVHFKDFLIKLQTLDIRVTSEGRKMNENGRKLAYYDLSHQNPYLNNAYRNELRELRELALTDILNLNREQILFQIKRLEELKGLFETFWERFYLSNFLREPDVPTGFLFSLNLSDLFITQRLSAEDGAIVNEMLLDDLKDTIQAREKTLAEFEQSVVRVLATESEPEKPSETPKKYKEKAAPVFKEPAATDFYELIKDYFEINDQPLLKDLLTMGKDPGSLLLFKGQGIQLSDAFKQLVESNLVIGCNKVELVRWITRRFTFLDKGYIRNYTEKYLQDVISSNTKTCQSPILDVRKRDGQFTILPTQRTGRKCRA